MNKSEKKRQNKTSSIVVNATLFKERLKTKLKDKKWTQSKLAEETNISARQISRWLNLEGNFPITATYFKLLCDKLGVRKEYFLYEKWDTETEINKVCDEWNNKHKAVLDYLQTIGIDAEAVPLSATADNEYIELGVMIGSTNKFQIVEGIMSITKFERLIKKLELRVLDLFI